MTAQLEQRAARGSIASLVNLGVTFALAIIQVPLMLSKWSAETFGVWAAIMGTIGMLTVLDSGHQNFVGNEFFRHWNTDRDYLAVILGSGCVFALILAGLELVIGGGLILTGQTWVGGTAATPSLLGGAKTSLLIYLLFWCVTGSLGGVLVRLYPPAGLFTRSQWFGVAGRLLGFAALIAAVWTGAGIVVAMIALVTASLAFNVYLFADIRRVFPALWPWWKSWSIRVGWHNCYRSLVLSMNGFLDQSSTNGVLVLTAMVLAPVEVAMFATVRTVANVFIQGTAVFLSPLVPDLARYHHEMEPRKITAVFSFSWLTGCSLLALGLEILVLFIEPLYAQWTRHALPLDKMLFGFMGLAVALRQWGSPLQVYVASINDLVSQTSVAIVRATLALGLGIVLLEPYGLHGVGFAIVISEFSGAIVLIRFSSRLVRDRGGAFPWASALLGFCQVLLCGVALSVFVFAGNAASLAVAILLLITGLVSWLMWRNLPTAAADRVRKLIGTYRARMGMKAGVF